MEKEHRDAIRQNFSSLVEQTDLDLMVSTLFEKGVFSDPMIEPYKDTSKDTRTRKRQLYRDITRRGPFAFSHLLDALMETGYWNLVRDLDPNSSLHPPNRPGPSQGGSNFLSIFDNKRKNTDKEQEDPYSNRASPPDSASGGPASGHDRITEQGHNGSGDGAGGGAGAAGGAVGTDPNKIPQFNVVMSKKFVEDNGSDIKLYHTRGRNRGVLVLFSYVEFLHNIEKYRSGALVDVDNLKYLFTELGLKVLTYNNLSLKETKKTLEELKNGICGEGPESVFVVFSSHGHARAGSQDTDIRCSDGQLISYFDIIDYFNNDRFPALRGVPKVFIFQICRGSNEDIHAPRHLPEPPNTRAHAHRHAGRTGRARAAASGAARAHTEQDGTVCNDDECVDEACGDERRYSDIIIANSTIPGYASNRDPIQGSWYIQALCSVFAARAHDCHVADLFTLVDEQLRKRFRTQTSSVDRWGFNRHLYLHPGLCEH